MKKKKDIPSPDLTALGRTPTDYGRNRLLLEWLSDDSQRAELFALINKENGSLRFASRDTWQRDCDHCGLDAPRPAPITGHRSVTLITQRAQIEAILKDTKNEYSNRVYAELGGGSFMLALDPHAGRAHSDQVSAFHKCFPSDPAVLQELSRLSCQGAAIIALRGPDFDLATFAEDAAVRFVQKLMGYSFADYRLLKGALCAGYRGLVYQVLGRHFTSDPTAIPEAKAVMARLLSRTSALVDAYAIEDEDALKGCEDTAVPDGFQPVLEKMAQNSAELNGEQLAVLAVGSSVGTVGNVQAAACIAVKAIFADPVLRTKVGDLAKMECGNWPTRQFDDWQKLIQETLKKNPPIPFLPRLKVGEHGGGVKEVLLALGGGTQDPSAPEGDDPLVWGLAETGKHRCAGMALAWPLIVEIVRHVMLQPGLAERLDPVDATPIGLTKRWGFACESYPLTHQRDRRVTQSSLNVAMRLKSPVKDNADRVREVIRSGAPLIEEALRGAKHVHFAWFELIESDTVLVLHTVYDGPFTAYIDHFALKVGDLFDELFACIETPPPMPVKKFPNEFVAHIHRFNRAPAMGYFFTAYPRSDVARILRDELARP